MEERKGLAFWNVTLPKCGGVPNEKVYIGGRGVGQRSLLVYNLKQDSYDTLPPYTYTVFSMAVVNNQLVLVGGVDAQTNKRTNKLGVWNEQSKRWTHPLPPMTTACNSPSVATHNNRWLMMMGGFDDKNHLSKVEILDTTESKKKKKKMVPYYNTTSAT